MAPLVAFWGTLAPEHVHESDADHPQSVVQRHLEPHDLAQPDEHGAEVDHGDGHGDRHIVWLDDVGAYQPAYQLPMPEAELAERFELAPAVASWMATSVDETAPPHGPPRFQQSDRAPPTPAL